jgi:hypothetical protein
MIQEQNLVYLASQVMDDVPEGGGAATGNVIPDGQLRNVFGGISALDRTYGRLKLRAIFLAVRTLTTDVLGGALSCITALPDDPALSYTLFTINNPFGLRVEAADMLSAYLYQGPAWPAMLLEDHVVGSGSIRVFQRVGTELPTIGKTLCLVQDEGTPQEIQQYVQVIKVSVETRTFSDSQHTNAEFDRWVVTLTLRDRLKHTFAGHIPRYYDNSYIWAGKTRIRDTTVADAMRYYGAQRLAAPASIGDRQIKAESIYTALVPASRAEEPVLDVRAAGETALTLAAPPSAPRTLVVTAAQHSQAVGVTAATRAYNYVFICGPLPAPGSVSVAYRAQGRWYTLTDDGEGRLTGTGAGSVSYITGTVSATLAALPDAGTLILLNWGEATDYTDRSGQAGWRLPEYQFPLADRDIEPNTLTITWTSAGTVVSVSDNGAGQLTGTGGTGTIEYHSGFIWLVPSAMPDPGVQFASEYQAGLLVEELKTGLSADGTGFVTLTTEHAITPGTLVCEWNIQTSIDSTNGNTEETTRSTKSLSRT